MNSIKAKHTLFLFFDVLPSVLKRTRTLFYFILFVTLAIKLYIAQLVPITGDEAEYIMWGQHLALGYYDHPPMIGWVMHMVNMLGNSNIILRSPQIIMSTVFALIMAKILKKWNTEKAYLLSSAYLVSPVSILDQGILTDTVLMWWVFLAVIFVHLSLRQTQEARYNPKILSSKNIVWYALSGICFGLAYLSKFLLLPAALGIFLYFTFNKNIPKRFTALCLIIGFATPFFLYNIGWNYDHDWVNYAFNLGLRNRSMHFGFKHFGLYLITVCYLYSPIVVLLILKKGISSGFTKHTHTLFLTLTFTTFLFYLPLSFFKSIGLHWLFCTYPFAFMALITVCNIKECKRIVIWMSAYTGIQLLIAIAILHTPMTFIQKHFSASQYEKANFFMNYAQLIPIIKPFIKKGYIIATASYSDSYLLTYKNHWTAAVWGVGTDNGRYDDFLSNFKKFNHKNIMVVDTQIRLTDKKFVPYFEHYTQKIIDLNNTKMILWIGYDFNYPLYRTHILQKIYHQYYSLPKWLPRSRHWFAQKYGFNSIVNKPSRRSKML